MGDRGPARKPVALIKRAGNPGHHNIASLNDSPSPKIDLPDCPYDLSGTARKEWERITAELYDNGLISNIDVQLIKDYCINVQIRDELFAYIMECRVDTEDGRELTGFTAYFYGKNAQTTGEYKAMLNAQNMIHKIAREFGMSPASRSRMNVIKPVQVEPGSIEEFLERKV